MTNDTPGEERQGYGGTVLADRYEVGELIGRDAMTETHKAHDRVLDKTVAVKFLSPQLANDEAFAARFVAEAQAAVTVCHQNAVCILDAGVTGSLHWIVQEYFEGKTLQQILRGSGGKLDAYRASRIAEEVSAGLAAAHAEGLYHRDVNPGTIFITNLGEVKLMGLGIVRVESTQTVAQARAVMGTAAYLSPEQAQGEPVDGRADIYSLGIVLYEMLTGKPPFAADSPVALAYMHVRDTPTPVEQVNSEVPLALAKVVMKAIEKKPEDRFATAQDFGNALSAARTPEAETAAAGQEGGEGEGEGEGGKEDEGERKDEAPAPPKRNVEEMFLGPAASGRGRRLSRRTWVLSGVVLLLVAIMAFFIFLLLPKNVAVPKVTGLNLSQAQQLLDDSGLKSGIGMEQETTEVSAGTVMGQAPDPGVQVQKGTTVILTVAKAPLNVAVPGLVGLSQADATSSIQAAGLTLGTVKQEVGTSPAGTVIAQDPAAGAVVPGGVAVNLTVAYAGQTVPVPTVICYTADKAATVLAGAGLKMTVSGVQANDLCPATGVRVAAMDPAAETQVAPGDVVQVWTTVPLPSPPSSPQPFSPLPSHSPTPAGSTP